MLRINEVIDWLSYLGKWQEKKRMTVEMRMIARFRSLDCWLWRFSLVFLIESVFLLVIILSVFLLVLILSLLVVVLILSLFRAVLILSLFIVLSVFLLELVFLLSFVLSFLRLISILMFRIIRSVKGIKPGIQTENTHIYVINYDILLWSIIISYHLLKRNNLLRESKSWAIRLKNPLYR